MQKTIITLSSPMCGGKTAIALAMRHRQRHLLAVPILCEAVDAGFAEVDGETILALDPPETAVLPAIRRAMCKHDYLLSDTAIGLARLLAECGGSYRLVDLFTVTHGWLIEARRRLRYSRYPDDPTQYNLGPFPTPGLIRETIVADEAEPAFRTYFVDTSDWPVHMVGVTEAEAIKEVRRTRWKPRCRAAEANELPLPKTLGGRTILLVGDTEGELCCEVVGRGAAYVVSVVQDDAERNLLRRRRADCQLPVSICSMDPVRQSLPILNVHGFEIKYDLGIVANGRIAVLERLRRVCRSVVFLEVCP